MNKQRVSQRGVAAMAHEAGLSGRDKCLHSGTDGKGCIFLNPSVADRAFVSKHCLVDRCAAQWESSDSPSDVFAYLGQHSDASIQEKLAVLLGDQQQEPK